MTQRQLDLLDFIKAYMLVNRGKVPSFSEMMQGIGVKSKSTVARLLDGLEKRGKLSRLRRHKRAIEIILP